MYYHWHLDQYLCRQSPSNAITVPFLISKSTFWECQNLLHATHENCTMVLLWNRQNTCLWLLSYLQSLFVCVEQLLNVITYDCMPFSTVFVSFWTYRWNGPPGDVNFIVLICHSTIDFSTPIVLICHSINFIRSRMSLPQNENGMTCVQKWHVRHPTHSTTCSAGVRFLPTKGVSLIKHETLKRFYGQIVMIIICATIRQSNLDKILVKSNCN